MNVEEESDRPRRLEDNSAAYLLSMVPKLDELSKIKDESALEEQEILVGNVFEEINNRTASAACDKRTNSIIEQLLLMANLEVLLEAMSKFTPYAKFLALNRHSSHVLQALFARTSYIFKFVGIEEALEEEAVKAILALSTALLTHLDLLMQDMCGSHVVRSLICLLAGMPAVGEKKGKNSKHQHAAAAFLSMPMEALQCPDLLCVHQTHCYSVPESFHDCLVAEIVINNLMLKTPEQLQEVMRNTNCSAVVSLLLRVLFNPVVIQGGAELANQLVAKILCVPEGMARAEALRDIAQARKIAVQPTSEGDAAGCEGEEEESRRKKHKKDKKEKKSKDKKDKKDKKDEEGGAERRQGDAAQWEQCIAAVTRLSTHAASAYFMECVVECADGQTVLCPLLHNAMLVPQRSSSSSSAATSVFSALAADGTGNYVAQAVCRRLAKECKRQHAVVASGAVGIAGEEAVLLLSVVRSLIRATSDDLFATTTTTSKVRAAGEESDSDNEEEQDNVSSKCTVVSIASTAYNTVIRNGGVVMWALDAVRWHDASAATALPEATSASCAADQGQTQALSNIVGMTLLQCWVTHYKKQTAEGHESSAGTGTVVLSSTTTPAGASKAPASLTQSQVSMMVQARLAPHEAPRAVSSAAAAAKGKNAGKGGNAPAGTDSGVPAQILFGRQLQHLMQLLHIPVQSQSASTGAGAAATPSTTICKAAKYVVTAISSLPASTVQHVAKAGQLSRPVLDTFIDAVLHSINSATASAMAASASASAGRRGSNMSIFAEDFRRFHATLLTCAVDLAMNPTGLHTIKRVFENTHNMGVKESFASLFADNFDTIVSSSGSGRGVGRYLLTQVCHADTFRSQGREEWLRQMQKRERSMDLLSELDGMNKPRGAGAGAGSSSSSSSSSSRMEQEVDEAAATSSKKRKLDTSTSSAAPVAITVQKKDKHKHKHEHERNPSSSTATAAADSDQEDENDTEEVRLEKSRSRLRKLMTSGSTHKNKLLSYEELGKEVARLEKEKKRADKAGKKK